MDNWIKVCANCLAPVNPAVFKIPAAAAYGATEDYACEKCGHFGKPIEVTPKMLEKIQKEKTPEKKGE